MTKHQIQKLVEQAGFVLFENSHDIDWSCDYTQELEQFADLIVQQCATFCGWEQAQDMLEHFGIKKQ